MGANKVIGWSDGGAGPLVNSCRGPAGSALSPLAPAVGLSEVTAHRGHSQAIFAGQSWREGKGWERRERSPLREPVTARHYIKVINNPLSIY